MIVTVELFSYFRKGRFDQDMMELPSGATVADLANQLEIDIADVGVLIINGISATKKDRLETGDRITFLPIIGGG